MEERGWAYRRRQPEGTGACTVELLELLHRVAPLVLTRVPRRRSPGLISLAEGLDAQ